MWPSVIIMSVPNKEAMIDQECPDEPIGIDAKRALPFAVRLILGLIAVTTLTALASLLVLYAMWTRSFNQYAAENLQWYAQNTASQIAAAYATNGGFNDDTLQPAYATVEVSPDIVLVVYDAQGKVVFAESKAAPEGDKNAFVEPVYLVAKAEIDVDGKAVGLVKLWVYGANSLINKHDEMLKQDTLFALDISVLAAAIVASVAGYFMAKRLTRPIKDLTATTERIAQGDLAARTNVRGIDEVARLGMAIDEMACAIERDRVQERRITTDMAHEIRTPLMAIRATVEAMIDGVFEADEEHLQVVEDEVLRISRLVEQLMRLSRLESRSTPFKKEEVDLSSIVSDVAMSFTALAEEAGLSMICDVAPDVRIVGDPDMTKQAVTNLVSNAIRYTSAGFVHISLAREGRMARVDVQDSGVGLSEQDQEVVFDRLWRADSARESNNGGLGIGLAMVREIMDCMGGRASVKSRLGEGSTFTLYFPLSDL